MMDSRHSNIIYAATWDRHRNVAAYMGGGPGTKLKFQMMEVITGQHTLINLQHNFIE